MTPFLHKTLLKSERRAWGAAVGMVLLSFGWAPWTRPVVTWLRDHQLLLAVISVLTGICLLYVLIYLICNVRMGVRVALQFILLVGLAVFLTWEHRFLEERIHLLQFAVISLLLYKACSFRYQGILLFGVPLLLTLVLGWLDELWQAYLPNRYFDTRDIFDNTLGGLVGIGLARIRRTYGLPKKTS